MLTGQQFYGADVRIEHPCGKLPSDEGYQPFQRLIRFCHQVFCSSLCNSASAGHYTKRVTDLPSPSHMWRLFRKSLCKAVEEMSSQRIGAAVPPPVTHPRCSSRAGFAAKETERRVNSAVKNRGYDSQRGSCHRKSLHMSRLSHHPPMSKSLCFGQKTWERTALGSGQVARAPREFSDFDMALPIPPP